MTTGSANPGDTVPSALRMWFVFHFVADWLFAIPLFFFPEAFLGWLGWANPDPATSRVVAAALVGIGTRSLLERNSSRQTFRSLLDLKILWSATAALGLGWTAATSGPAFVWVLFGIFVAFNGLWTYYRLQLR